MEQGQPALLYICPIILGTIFFLGRANFKNLWNGAEVFGLAEQLIIQKERERTRPTAIRPERINRRQKEENSTSSLNHNENGGPVGQSNEVQGNSSRRQLSRTSTDDTNTIDTLPTFPTDNDICFSDEDHPGTKLFREAVVEVTTEMEGEEYSPKVHKAIRAKLKGRRYFKRNSDTDDTTTTPLSWIIANKFEVRNEIGLAYDACRGKKSRFFDKKESKEK
jgi:hypothetical protein